MQNKGTRVHPLYGITEVKHGRRYEKYNTFIIASKATQVFFANYLSRLRVNQDWLVVIKTKPKEDIENTASIPAAHQEECMSNFKELANDEDDQIIANETELQLEEVDLDIEENIEDVNNEDVILSNGSESPSD
ncbi:hypothetical protein M5K25_011382 [Dendrobium thyrsiflorum]|uniref:DUF4216 domain-containing protein n=1 Tax=Dendrobium thyrsiflorum TaxID=117978 RepID=A0ABD0V9N4_DENTH